MGDIGSHAENLAATITGLHDRRTSAPTWRRSCRAAASTTTATVLLRFEGGARGVLLASQIAVGHENDLRDPRASATGARCDWRQEDPNTLRALAARAGRAAS